MKKILLILGALLALNSFTFADEAEDEFTWAKYEMICMKFDVEPSYEKYVWLCENPQCLIPEVEELKEIPIGDEDVRSNDSN